jgi:hypothetical protein
VLYLASQNDMLCWQVGATCNKLPKDGHADIYERFAGLLGRSHWTIQQWAYIERNVPLEARVSGLSFSHHKAVAKIDEPGIQLYHLRICQEHGWPVGVFRDWLSEAGIEVEPEHYQSDRSFEEQQTVYQLVTELADTRRERDEARAQLVELVTLPKIDPDTFPDLNDLARPIAGWLQNQRTFNTVLIRRNGEVVIKP